MSLFDAAERFASLDRSQVVLDAARCLHTQDRFSGCTRCFEVCPVGAIHPGKPPRLDGEACKSCLACLPVCPLGAFQADDDVSHVLSCATHIEEKSVELLCGLHPHPETGADPARTGVRIQACLAGLGFGVYLALATLGVEDICLRTDGCETCAWQCLQERIYAQAERARSFLAAWGHSAAITCVDEIEKLVERPLWDARNPPLSRRDLFRMLGRQGQVALARALEQPHAHTRQSLGRDRLRLLSAVEHLPPRRASEIPTPESFDFAILAVSDACTACGVCARACPSRALHFEQDAETNRFTLAFQPRHCIGCEVCVHVCAPAAITLSHTPPLDAIFGSALTILQTGELVKCMRCGVPIARREQVRLCPICEYRRKNPFGSASPPGLIRPRPDNDDSRA